MVAEGSFTRGDRAAYPHVHGLWERRGVCTTKMYCTVVSREEGDVSSRGRENMSIATVDRVGAKVYPTSPCDVLYRFRCCLYRGGTSGFRGRGLCRFCS